MQEWKLIIKNNLKEITTIVKAIDILAEKWDLPMKTVFNLNLALEELITNTISYGYQSQEECEIEITFSYKNKILSIHICDNAKAFNPLENDTAPDLDASLEDKNLGGLGIFFVKKVMNRMDYNYEDGMNMLRLELTTEK